MKNKIHNDKSNLVSLLDFPFDIKTPSTNLDNKLRFYKNILEHFIADKNDPKLSGGIATVLVDSSPLIIGDGLNQALNTLLYGIIYGSMGPWEANDWLAKHPAEAFKNPDQLKNINYEDYNIIKIHPYKTGQYKGHNPKYDIYSEDQYLFIRRGGDNPSIVLGEDIPLSFNRDNHRHAIIYWRGYIQHISLNVLKNNGIFFTSKSNLIAGIKEDSFTEQTILANLLEE